MREYIRIRQEREARSRFSHKFALEFKALQIMNERKAAGNPIDKSTAYAMVGLPGTPKIEKSEDMSPTRR